MAGAFRARAYAGEADLERVIAGRVAYRARTHRERYPAVGRLRLLVASRLHEPERNARVWEDEAGRAVGFAALLQRRPRGERLALEWIVDPSAYGAGLEAEMLAWALRRAQEMAGAVGTEVTLHVTVGEDDAEDPSERARLVAAGFRRLDAHPLYLVRDLTEPLPDESTPPGITVRPLCGEDELAQYMALYDATFTPVPAGYRRALVASADHTHLVAVPEDGGVVAFCECGVEREEWEHAGARVGWVEYVATAPEWRGRGGGRAVTRAGLRWLRERGCDAAMLVTGEGNVIARGVYERLGFGVAAREVVWQVTGVGQHTPL